MCEHVKQALHTALEKLLHEDCQLLVDDVNERSISHRLAVYLEELFPGWNVDCEYNRDVNDPKRLNLPPRHVSTDDTQATTVFPDIIIHKRGTNKNLLVIEMKKSSNPEGNDFDIRKLNAFKSQMGYQFAVFVKLRTGNHSPAIENVEWM